MISLSELNPKKYDLTDEIRANLEDLLVRLNKVRVVWGHPMIITSGLRSVADQQRINPKAPKSRHLEGNAADVLDQDGAFNQWCIDNQKLLAEVGLWCETRVGPWQHLQRVPPKSGRRFFIP